MSAESSKTRPLRPELVLPKRSGGSGLFLRITMTSIVAACAAFALGLGGSDRLASHDQAALLCTSMESHRRAEGAHFDALVEAARESSQGERWVTSLSAARALRGQKIFHLDPQSLWAQLGLENGDFVVAVGGKELGQRTPAQLLPTQMPATKDSLSVTLLREGCPRQHHLWRD